MSDDKPKPMCGIVMPISAIDGCIESHWVDVREIISEAVEAAGFESNLVSNADDVGIIHKRIIQNLYDNPVVVCDVSGKNPNVMFELGMRLAFDKPTVIIKDDKTSYSFDTSAIEHLEYPRDLRFSRIVEFKQKLAEKILATYTKATQDPQYTTFLKHFGEFTVAKIDKKEVSSQEFILEELRGVRNSLRRIEMSGYARDSIRESLKDSETSHIRHGVNSSLSELDICMEGWSSEKVEYAVNKANSIRDINRVRVREVAPDHKHLLAFIKPGADRQEIEDTIKLPNRIRRDRKSMDSSI